jgi:hypothetical protein
MNTTTQPGPLEVRLSDQLGRISPTALQDATKAVQAFGCSMAQAAQALQAIGNAGKRLEAETAALKRAAAAKRPWYRRGSW